MGIENEDVYASFGIVFSDYSAMHDVPEWSGTLIKRVNFWFATT